MKWVNSLTNTKLPKLTIKVTDKRKLPIPIKEIVFVVKKLPTKKTPGPYGFTKHLIEKYQFYKNSTEKTEDKKVFPNSFNEASIFLSQNEKKFEKKGNYRPLTFINIYAKFLTKV